MSGAELVLSVFPGIDLLGRAFEEMGFCVVRGPDVIWGGDIRTFHPPAGAFGGIPGSYSHCCASTFSDVPGSCASRNCMNSSEVIDWNRNRSM